jgi:hypothetical protein
LPYGTRAFHVDEAKCRAVFVCVTGEKLMAPITRREDRKRSVK